MHTPLPQEYAEAWEKAKAFHGHVCPGLAIGCRVAVDALAHFVHSPSVDEELVCVAETESCAVDAIQAITGCSMGKGNMLLRLRGKFAFSFFVRGRKKAARFYWHERHHDGSREETIMRFLSAPADELYSVTEPSYAVPPFARLNVPVVCAVCGEYVSEPYIRLFEGRFVCPDCHHPHPQIIL